MTDICVNCGSRKISEERRERILTVNGNRLIIPDDLYTKCADCETAFYSGAQTKIADQRMVEARRRAEQLLQSHEIRHIRQAMQLSQSDLELALGVGPKTVVRWETGTAVQSKALDDVLRLIALDPDNLRLLVRIRNKDSASGVERRLIPELMKKNAGLEEAIYAGIERANVIETAKANRLVNAVARAIRAYQRNRIEKLAQRAIA